ncbi:MAG: hydantoinase B/oxoprolinase family protein [Anaerolineae bacterium]
MRLDPFTAEIIAEALRASAEAMFLTLKRTSQSPIIYEVLDCACGLTAPDGSLVAEAEGIPGFIGCLSFGVRSILRKFGLAYISPGDIFITNDPYQGGGTHLSDVTLIAPIFYEGRLVAFAANKAHWTEMGGMAAGSWTVESTEIFQEGLQLPGLRICHRGQLDESLLELIEANVRLSRMTLGDLYAGIASLRAGETGVLEVCRKYGVEAVRYAMQSILEHGREVAWACLRQIPCGSYCAEDWIDDNGVGQQPLHVHVHVLVNEEGFTADFTGAPPQTIGPINTTRVGLEVSCREIFKAIVAPHAPNNEGLFDPLRVVCPDGTIFTAQRPSPVSIYWETGAYASELIWRALYPVVRERLPVGHSLSVCGTILSGMDEERGPFVLVEPQAGGWGATYDRDGESGLVVAGDGETYVMPVEVCEQRYPLLVEQYRFNTVPAGAGCFRGGFGLVRDYRILCSHAELTATFGRHRFPPWGYAGGADGSPNAIEVYPHNRNTEQPAIRAGKLARYALQRNDLVRLITGVGGGYGDPLTRNIQRVWEDVRNGFLRPEEATRLFGVVFSQNAQAVDIAATIALREARKRGER